MAKSISDYAERAKFEDAYWERRLRSFAPFRGTAPVRAALPWETTCTVCGMAILGPVLPTKATLILRPHRPHRFQGCTDVYTNPETGRTGLRPGDFCGGFGYHRCLYPNLPYRTDTFEDLQEYWVSDTTFTTKEVGAH